MNKLTITPYLSASLISGFEACPWRWARAYFNGSKGSGESAVWGTMFHGLMESLETEIDYDKVMPTITKIFGDEADQVFDYIRDIREMDMLEDSKLVKQEKEFGIFIESIGITLTGHMDEVRESDDGKTLRIRDYKTTYKYEPAVVWTNRIQPRLYMWAARILYPGYEHYEFQIVYPRQGKDVLWEPEYEGQALLVYIETIWNEINEYYRSGIENKDLLMFFPQIENDGCSHCHMKKECVQYQKQVNLQELPMIDNEPIGIKFERLKRISSAIEAEMSVVKEQILAQAPQGSKNVERDGQIFTIATKKDRSYNTLAVMTGIAALGTMNLNDIADILEIKLSKADALAKKNNAVAQVLEDNKTVKESAPFLIHYGSKKKKS